jgi:hypothetical protein
MIPFDDLGNTPEAVYSWQDDETGKIRLWLIDRINAWLPTAGIKPSMAAMDEERAEFFLQNRGIEMDRLEWLRDHPEHLAEPSVLMRMEVPKSEGAPDGFWDLTLDGHHRYVVLAAMRCPFFKFYHLTEDQCSQFEVSDVPQMSEEQFAHFVRNSPSMLELTR